jgi:hypothetical protein
MSTRVVIMCGYTIQLCGYISQSKSALQSHGVLTMICSSCVTYFAEIPTRSLVA